MNPPPNGIWHKSGGASEYGLFWDGTRYLATTDINTNEHHNYMMQNPEYLRIAVNIINDGADIPFIEPEELPGVEVVANRIRKIFSSETYDTPKKRSQAIFVVLAISAVTLGLLVYFKKIKI